MSPDDEAKALGAVEDVVEKYRSSLPQGVGRSALTKEPPNFSQQDVEDNLLVGIVTNVCYRGSTYTIMDRHATHKGAGHAWCAKCYVYNAGDAKICCLTDEERCIPGAMMRDEDLVVWRRMIGNFKAEKERGVPWSAPKQLPRDVVSQESALALEFYDYCEIIRTHPDERVANNQLHASAPYWPDLAKAGYPTLYALNEDGSEKPVDEAIAYNKPKRPTRGKKRKIKTEQELEKQRKEAAGVSYTVAPVPLQVKHEMIDEGYTNPDPSFSEEEDDEPYDPADPYYDRVMVQLDIPVLPVRTLPGQPYPKRLLPEFVLPTAVVHNTVAKGNLRKDMCEQSVWCEELRELMHPATDVRPRLLKFPDVFLPRLNERLKEVGQMMLHAGEDSTWPADSAVLKFDKSVAGMFLNPWPECAGGLTHHGLKQTKGFKHHLLAMSWSTAAELTRIEEMACLMLNNTAAAGLANQAAWKALKNEGRGDASVPMVFLGDCAELLDYNRDLALELLAWAVFRRRWTLTWAREKVAPKNRSTGRVIAACTRAYCFNDLLAWEPNK